MTDLWPRRSIYSQVFIVNLITCAIVCRVSFSFNLIHALLNWTISLVIFSKAQKNHLAYDLALIQPLRPMMSFKICIHMKIIFNINITVAAVIWLKDLCTRVHIHNLNTVFTFILAFKIHISATHKSGSRFLYALLPLLSLSPLSFLYFTSWKCPVLLGGWLCHMWNIHHLVIGFVIKCSCLVDHKGRNILSN